MDSLRLPGLAVNEHLPKCCYIQPLSTFYGLRSVSCKGMKDSSFYLGSRGSKFRQTMRDSMVVLEYETACFPYQTCTSLMLKTGKAGMRGSMGRSGLLSEQNEGLKGREAHTDTCAQAVKGLHISGEAAESLRWMPAELQETCLAAGISSNVSESAEEKLLREAQGTGAIHDVIAGERPNSITHSRITKANLGQGHVDVIHGPEKLRIFQDGSLELRREKNKELTLIATGRVHLPKHSGCFPELCRMRVVEESSGAVEVQWLEDAVLRVVPAGGNLEAVSPCLPGSWTRDWNWAQKLDEGFVCEFSVRQIPGEVEMAETTLDVRTSGHWFGGGHFMRQHWPLNLGAFEIGPFLPFDNGPNGLNTLLAAQWMTSRGLLVLADPDTPFFHVGFNSPVIGPHDGWIQRSWGTGVQNLTKEYLPSHCEGQGDGLLHLQARSSYICPEMLHPLCDWVPALSEASHHGSRRLAVRFALCATSNVKEAAMAALRTLNRPEKPPPQEMVTAPIWTTWARYHAKVNQVQVERYAKEIVARGLERSIMEIDDKWQSKYGDFDFDRAKFPDPKAMVEGLHALGFRVTLWVMPFAEEASEAYREGAPKGYFISSDAPPTRGLKPGFFRWWQPVPAAALDVTNPEAVKWFVARLKKLQADYAIDGFKFDAGEPCFLPRRFRTHAPIMTPTEYTRLYVQEVASHFSFAEVRTGHRTNSAPLLTRMGDRFSTWSSGNGLRSLIPTLLTSGLLGYPFCLPDMVGGNAYFGRKPDMELLVRWAQANAFMPAVQFSIAPWDLSQEADKLCKSVMELRKVVVGRIVQLMEDACHVLAPVCRPMWWLDPEDAETFIINDQFAIGDDLIVAPVVVKGQKKRDVYLPRGLWMELLSPHGQHEGPCWLRDVAAPLHTVPIFRRVVKGPHGAPLAVAVAVPTLASASELQGNPTANC